MKQGRTVRKERVSRITAGLVFLLLLWPAISTAGEVTLAWDANSETNLAGYKLYYDGDADTEMYGGSDAKEGDSPIVIYLDDLADPETPTFTLTGLTNGEYHYFALTAFNSNGLESDFSDEVGVMIKDGQSASSSEDTSTETDSETGSDSSDDIGTGTEEEPSASSSGDTATESDSDTESDSSDDDNAMTEDDESTTLSDTTSAADANTTSSVGGCFIVNTTAQDTPFIPVAIAGLSLLLATGIRSTLKAGRPLDR